MKRLAISAAVIGLAISGIACGQDNLIKNHYADCGIIMQDPDENVVITMQNGHMFSFENLDGDWNKGDIVSVIFDDNGTEKIFDDIIVSYKYSGWISDAEMQDWVK